MWPWGHLAVAYVLYSGGRRLLGRSPPADWPALALALGALAPDLVDKPLSWGLGVFPSGYAVGHSVFVALPLGIALLVGGAHSGERRVTVPFVVGYWSHLAGDVFSGLLYGDELTFSPILWPVVEQQPYGESLGLFGRGFHYLGEFLDELTGSDPPMTLVLAAVAPLLFALALWLLDGTPGPRALGRLWAR